MAKGLDLKFLHYGIRKEDLELIRTLCEKSVTVTRKISSVPLSSLSNNNKGGRYDNQKYQDKEL